MEPFELDYDENPQPPGEFVSAQASANGMEHAGLDYARIAAEITENLWNPEEAEREMPVTVYRRGQPMPYTLTYQQARELAGSGCRPSPRTGKAGKETKK